MAKAKDLELSHGAVAWLLNQKGIDTVIPGGKRAEQIRGSVRAVEVSLNGDVMKEIESILED
ncbi:aldo/keto reductase [Bacillus tropicus]|nr:aldo/keto reductase [Bacillus tropicus]